MDNNKIRKEKLSLKNSDDLTYSEEDNFHKRKSNVNIMKNNKIISNMEGINKSVRDSSKFFLLLYNK